MIAQNIKIIVDAVTNSATQSFERLGKEMQFNTNAATDLASGIIRATVAVTGFASAAQGLRSAINMVDDYRKSTISVAAMLTDSLSGDQETLNRAFEQNQKYAENTYRQLELAARRYFASGQELIEAWEIMATKGIALDGPQQIDDLGVIVDRIKLATKGQTTSLQIAQEMRSVLNGQARMTDQISQILKQRVGPAWREQLYLAMEEGRVLEWVSDQFRGMKSASEAISRTLENQKTSFSTLIRQATRTGLAGAYEDLVNLLDQANERLETQGYLLSDRIAGAYDRVREKALAAYAITQDHPLATAGAQGAVVGIAQVAFVAWLVNSLVRVSLAIFGSSGYLMQIALKLAAISSVVLDPLVSLLTAASGLAGGGIAGGGLVASILGTIAATLSWLVAHLPMMLMAAAAAVVVSATVNALYQRNESVRAGVDWMMSYISAAIQRVPEYISWTFNLIAQFFRSIGDMIGNTLQAAILDLFDALIGNIWRKLQEWIAGFGKVDASAWDDIPIMGRIYKTLATPFNSMVQKARDEVAAREAEGKTTIQWFTRLRNLDMSPLAKLAESAKNGPWSYGTGFSALAQEIFRQMTLDHRNRSLGLDANGNQVPPVVEPFDTAAMHQLAETIKAGERAMERSAQGAGTFLSAVVRLESAVAKLREDAGIDPAMQQRLSLWSSGQIDPAKITENTQKRYEILAPYAKQIAEYRERELAAAREQARAGYEQSLLAIASKREQIEMRLAELPMGEDERKIDAISRAAAKQVADYERQIAALQSKQILVAQLSEGTDQQAVREAAEDETNALRRQALELVGIIELTQKLAEAETNDARAKAAERAAQRAEQTAERIHELRASIVEQMQDWSANRWGREQAALEQDIAALRKRAAAVKTETAAEKRQIEEIIALIESLAAKRQGDLSARMGDNLFAGFSQGLKEWNDQLPTLYESGVTVAQSTAEAMTSSFDDLFFDTFTGKLDDLRSYVSSFAESVLHAITSILARAAAIKTMTAIGLGGLLGSANGNVLRGGFRTFATGGVVTGPTLGIIGEGRYNEAVVPLPDGRRIPVDMRGPAAGSITVNVYNQGQKVDATAKVQTDGRDTIISIFMDAYRTDRMGLRTALRGA